MILGCPISLIALLTLAMTNGKALKFKKESNKQTPLFWAHELPTQRLPTCDVFGGGFAQNLGEMFGRDSIPGANRAHILRVEHLALADIFAHKEAALEDLRWHNGCAVIVGDSKCIACVIDAPFELGKLIGLHAKAAVRAAKLSVEDKMLLDKGRAQHARDNGGAIAHCVVA